MLNLDDFTGEVVIWCSFCNSCPGDAGTLDFPIDEHETMALPICSACLDKAREAGKIEE